MTKSDKVDAAIAATEGPTPVDLEQVTVTIASTGRPFFVAFPKDLTEPELFEVTGWMATNLRVGLAERRAAANPASRLVVARGVLPGHN